jgi:hypothetical protein
MSSIQEVETQIRTNFTEWFHHLRESFDDNKKDFHIEVGHSFKERTDKNKLQKQILIKLTDTIKMLSPIIQTFNQRNPDKILGQHPETDFYYSPKLSPILSLLTEIIIWTSDKFIEVLDIFNYEITQMEKHLSNRPETEANDIIVPAIFETIKAERKEFEEQFKSYNDETLIIQRHWIRFVDKIPEDIFQVFESSIFFEDSDILKVITDNCESVPSKYRIKWLFTDFTNITYLINRKIKMNFLIDDVDILFSSYLKNPENIHSIVIISCILCKIKLDVPIDKLIRLVSILLTIISKLNSEKDTIVKDRFEHTICLLVDTINNIAKMSSNITSDLQLVYPIFNSYLAYLVPSILNGIYGQCEDIDKSIDEIILKINKMDIVYMYMGSTSNKSSDIKFRTINILELEKWIQIFKDVQDEEEYNEIEDGLLCTCVIKPVLLPNTDLVFDRYVIESSLWETSTNPYTREPLTMEEFKMYNEESHIKEEIKKKRAIVKNLIDKYK